MLTVQQLMAYLPPPPDEDLVHTWNTGVPVFLPRALKNSTTEERGGTVRYCSLFAIILEGHLAQAVAGGTQKKVFYRLSRKRVKFA